MKNFELAEKYEKLTDENQHGEAAALLANFYGDKSAEKMLIALNEYHRDQMSASPELLNLRLLISSPFYLRAVEAGIL